MSRETRIEWPHDTLGCALRADYVGRVDQRFARTEVADGPARYRLMKNEERRVYRLAFLWTLAQVNLWETFHDSMLGAGMRWFMMRQLTGRGLQPMFCHVLEGWEITPHAVEMGRYLVTFDVEAFHSAASAPLPGVTGGPIDAGLAVKPSPVTDAIDALPVTDPRPLDGINGLSPGALF